MIISDIERIFGEQRQTQEEALKKRKDRIRQLRKEKMKQVDAEEKAQKQKRTVRNCFCFEIALLCYCMFKV